MITWYEAENSGGHYRSWPVMKPLKGFQASSSGLEKYDGEERIAGHRKQDWEWGA